MSKLSTSAYWLFGFRVQIATVALGSLCGISYVILLEFKKVIKAKINIPS